MNKKTPPLSPHRRLVEGLGRQISRYAEDRSNFQASAGSCQTVPGSNEVVSGNQVTKVRAVPVEVEANELAGTKGRVSVMVGAYVPSY